jgi:hypothetical protein
MITAKNKSSLYCAVVVISVMEGFQKWIIRADYLPDNPMDTPRIKFTETIKSSRQIIDPRCKFVSCGVNGLPSTIKNK